jgi:hypothetical protein
VFAVLMYALAHAESEKPDTKPSVDLHPDLLAATFGCSTQVIQEAIAVLCEKPGPYLRGVRSSPYRYYVIRFDLIKQLRRFAIRDYNRIAKRRSRQRLAQQGGA